MFAREYRDCFKKSRRDKIGREEGHIWAWRLGGKRGISGLGDWEGRGAYLMHQALYIVQLPNEEGDMHAHYI